MKILSRTLKTKRIVPRSTTGLLTGETKCFSVQDATLFLGSSDFRSQMLHKTLPFSKLSHDLLNKSFDFAKTFRETEED